MNVPWNFEDCAAEDAAGNPAREPQSNREYTHGARGRRPGRVVYGYGFSQPQADERCRHAADVSDAYEVIGRAAAC